MAKLAVPASGCAGVDVDGVRYHAKDGILDVPDNLVGRLKTAGECFTPTQPVRAPGFICPDCGFHALLRTCGRCGAQCHRPGEAPDDTAQPAQDHANA